jgi:hypothetical protein
MNGIAALPRQSLFWLVAAFVRSGATFRGRTGQYKPRMVTKRAPQVHRAVSAAPRPLPPRPAREIALRCRRCEDRRLNGNVP